MALVLLDRVKESTSTVGTGSIALGGAAAGYQAFSAIGNGNTCYYAISSNGAEWEVGIGTYTSSGNTLSRDTILSSSNGGSIVPLSAGAKDVYIVYPAEKAIYEEVNGDVIIRPGVLTVQGPGVSSYTTLDNSVAQLFANQNDYAQVNMQNQSSGASASGDYIATANDGTDTTKFIDMGINSSGFSDAGFTIVGAYGGYLYVQDGELALGTGSANNIKFFTGDTLAANEKARIVDATGNFLIGTTTDSGYKLNVNGSSYVSGAATFGSTVTLNADPSLALQAATKQYVDNQVTAGLHIHAPVLVETTGNLTASYTQGGTTFNITDITGTNTVTTSVNHGLSVNDQIWLYNTAGNGLSTNTAYFVYSTPALNQLTLSLTFGGAQITGLTNASGLTYNTRANSGVGATLTNSGAQAALVIDNVTMTVGDRVMVRLQTNGFENGVYEVTDIGSISTNWELERASDSNQVNPANPNGLGTGDYYFTQDGDLNAGDSHVLTTEPNTMIIGYTTLTYTQFSGAVTYVGGTNIDVTGQTISLTGTVAATNGGTGNNTVTTGDLLYGSGTNTWGKLGIGTAGYTLLSNGTNVSWGALDLAGAGVTGVLPEVHGGTNQNSYVVGDTLYASGTNTLAKLSPNTSTTRQYLGQTGTGSAGAAPTWSTLAAGDITSGTLPTTYGGTGISSYTAGDITYYASGTNLSKLGIGTNTYILTSTGSAPQWTDPSSITIGTATLATTATNLGSGALGDVPYQSSAGNTSFLGANTTTTKKFMVETGTGSAGQAPVWDTIQVADVPTLNQNTTGTAAGLSATLAVTSGGTGQTTYTDGQLLIGNSATNGLSKATITAGTNISVTNGNGTITIANTQAAGVTITNDTSTATSVYPTFTSATTGSVSGLSVTSTKFKFVPSTGTFTVPNVEASNGMLVNSATISTSYSIPVGSNAIAAGPITVGSGASVTVPSGSRWVVL